METQPNQHGLTQLFMSLGLAKDNPLTTLNSDLGKGDHAHGLGFEGVLADYMPEDPLSKRGLSDTTDSLSEVGLGLIQPATVDKALAGLENSGEDLLPPIGEPLPPTEETILNQPRGPKGGGLSQAGIEQDEALTQNVDVVDRPQENSTEVDDLLRQQGFHAQSLVTGLLPATTSANSAQHPIASSGMSPATNSAFNNSGLNNTAINNAALKKVSDPLAKAAGAISNSTVNDLGLDSGEGSNELILTRDRFLGAEGTTTNKMLSPERNALAPTLAQGPSAQTVPVMEAVPLAVSMNEDPTINSLEELADIEEIEQEGVETKLMSSERKQDEQTLKLTKGQQAWGDALAERITMNAAKDVKQVTIHLDPPELGSLELKLQVKDDQQTQVQVQVQNPQVKEALESSAHRLREMLAGQGLELSEFDVQTGANQQQAQQGDQQSGSEQQNSDTLGMEGEEIKVDISLPKNNNLLDTFV